MNTGSSSSSNSMDTDLVPITSSADTDHDHQVSRASPALADRNLSSSPIPMDLQTSSHLVGEIDTDDTEKPATESECVSPVRVPDARSSDSTAVDFVISSEETPSSSSVDSGSQSSSLSVQEDVLESPASVSTADTKEMENDLEGPPPIVCSICFKDLSQTCYNNPTNVERHEDWCRTDKAKKEAELQIKQTKGVPAISSFFIKRPRMDQANNVGSVEEPPVSTADETVQPHERVEPDELVESNANPYSSDIISPSTQSSIDLTTADTARDLDASATEIVASDPIHYCAGYDISGELYGNVYQNFPFQLLESCTFVFSNGRFHSEECAYKHFVCDGSNAVNWTCSRLCDDNNMKKLIHRAQLGGDDLSGFNFMYLTYHQMKAKIDGLLKEKNIQRLERYKVNSKMEKLNKTLSLYKRFVVQISENNIPRLNGLVKVALKNSRSISYILDKCTDAIAGLYKARPSQDDRDLAFLVLKFGGPSLLSLLYQANVLPSVSLAYKISKNSVHLQSSVTLSFRQCCEKNLGPLKKMQDEDHILKYSFSIKADETFINSRLRYDCRSNEMVGVCYEHHDQVSLQFDSMAEVMDLQYKLKNDEVHIPKECLVTGLSSLVKNIPFQVILMWPSCSKNDFERSCEMYVSISDSMVDILGAPAQNFNSDGDTTRRQALHAITNHDLDLTSELGKIIVQLDFVDLKVGKHNETLNFDAKHIAKRCRTSLISEKLVLKSLTLTKKDVGDILALSERRTHDVDSLLNPKDKQNVPLASDTLLSFIEVVTDIEKQKKLPLKLLPVTPELIMLASVYEAIMCMYSYVNFSLTEQITTIAKGAVSLLVLQRNCILDIPTQLYHDIQCTLIDTVYCVAKLQISSPEASFYTALNGTDPEERWFGNVRMAMKHKNLDA